MGRPGVIPDSAILAAYSAVSGYVPGDPSTDVGAACLDVLNYWRSTGIGGDQIAAYASVKPLDFAHVKLATYWFGSVYIGFQVPQNAMDQFQAGQHWTCTGDTTSSVATQSPSWPISRTLWRW